MNSTPLAERSFPVRLAAYLNERYPAYQLAGGIPMFLSAFLIGQIMAGRTPALNIDAVVGFCAFFGFTFAARANDDHKDYEHDSIHFPNRVLQRGLITLRHLKVLGGAAFLLSLLGSLYIDRGFGRVTFWWVLQIVVLCVHQIPLILRPQAHEWLEERRVLLAFTVLPFYGLGGIWLTQMGAKEAPLTWQGWIMFAVWIFGPMLMEIVRKSRTPEDDRPTLADYAKPRVSWAHSLGLHPTAIAIAVLILINAGLLTTLLWSVDYLRPWSAIAVVGIAAVCTIAGLGLFLARPDRYRIKTLSEIAATSAVSGHIVVVIALLMGR